VSATTTTRGRSVNMGHTELNFGGGCDGRCWNILRPFDIRTIWAFGIFCGHLVYLSPFWYVVLRKIWQPWHWVDFNNQYY
jgi:hypothetical protein